MQWLLLPVGGVLSGVLAGLFGIGGAILMIPLLITMGAEPVQATATSSLAIVIVALSGTWQNWKMGLLKLRKVLYLGSSALVTAQLGVYLANRFPPHILLICYGILLSSSFYLIGLKKRLVRQGDPVLSKDKSNSGRARVLAAIVTTGGTAGLLAGLLGVSGGVVLVPMQILLLGEPIKVAIQTSLGVTAIAASSACIGHALGGNVLWADGLILGVGGMLGAHFGIRWLPRLSDAVVTFSFRTLLALMSTYIFWRAWLAYATATV
ncbi:sulfite exporter TauE/SafE family protein [Leptolyngbya sp. FACHB-261]|uniref:sulfite exporter TauE/SafE family protein n=1 Tax=Leptolyngbya sp. FACHB-261 TaxID=2692806 RepID=UPI001684925A|nr:sulfite exporter TauE/SafE family protein [Leptolyngbya sp. FACHB-261]MBD2104028.1 sulfite exporter TauE/SafE family protein [Leptolyngbya sp. FACHB-261]